MKKDELIELGTCNRPHGIKGGFHFFLYNPEDSILKNGKIVELFPKDSSSSINTSGESFKIKSIQFGNKTICYLDEITDRNIVEAMIPFTIMYPRSKFPKPQEGEFYLNDLVAMEVINTAGETIGEIHSFYDNGAQTVLRIKLSDEIIDLPFVDNFFPDVDLENKKVTMITPEISE